MNGRGITAIKILGFLMMAMAQPGYALAYEISTHAELTNTSIKIFEEESKNNNINIIDKFRMVRGAKEEDAPPRYINHFFDPIRRKGWLGLSLFNLMPLPSIKWAFDSSAQRIPIYDKDWSWPPKNGANKSEALGHVMHLLQDLSVPEHSRLDTHLPLPGLSSPYETFFKTSLSGFDKYVIGKTNNALEQKIIESPDLNSLFEYLANYSNQYFFSEDTINVPQYPRPKIIRFENQEIKQGIKVKYGMGKDENEDEFRLVAVLPPGKNKWRELLSNKKYTVNDPQVMEDYASRLIPKAILSGKSALRIGLDDKTVLGASTNIPFTEQIKDEIVYRPKKNETTAKAKNKKIESSLPVATVIEQPHLEIVKPEPLAPSSKLQPIYAIPASPELIPILAAPSVPNNNQQAQTQPYIVLPAQNAISLPTATNEQQAKQNNDLPSGQSVQTQEQTISVQPQPMQYLAINEVAWAGTSSSTADEWIELYNPSNGEINLSGWILYAEDGSPKIDLKGTVKPFAYFLLERTDDSTIPQIKADQIYVGNLGNDGENLILKDNFGRTVDQLNFTHGWPAGDSATRSTMQRINPKTDGSEPQNWTSSPNQQGSPKSPNPGSVLSNNTEIRAIWPRISFNQISLNVDSSSTVQSTTTINLYQVFYKPLVSSLTPCAINEESSETLPQSTSTEKSFILSPLESETYYCLASRYWTEYGLSLFRTAIIKTLSPPLSSNLKRIGGDIYGNQVWSPTNNPYIITSTLTVKPDATLLIEPGVVVKFENGKQILVDGTLTAVGTEENPIVFTSFYDDEFAGDTNGDFSSTTPQKGDWERIQMGGTYCTNTCGILRGPVTLSRTIIRYGGGPTSRAMLYNSGSDNKIISSDIGYSLDVGLLNLASSASSSTTTIRFNFFHDSSTAIKTIAGAKTDISDNIFQNNAKDTFP